MKSVWKYMLVPLVAAVTASGAFAQVASQGGNGGNSDALNFNHPPCDFSDAFYQGIEGDDLHPGNGVNVAVLNDSKQQRFGIFRQSGPPATGAQQNWVNDPTCSQNDPTKKDVRILATTGGYSDDGTINANQFINIIAFLTTPKVFTGIPNARNIKQQDLVNNFEAYVNLKQRQPDGTFLGQPCGSLSTNTGSAGPVFPTATATPLNKPGVNCFPVTSAATPALASNWRFGSDRNAVDNLAEPHNDPFGLRGASATNPAGGVPASVPYGYFCDDLLGTWVVIYFWLTFDPTMTSSDPRFANAAPCFSTTDKKGYSDLAAKNGTNLDGGPVIKIDGDLDGLEDLTAVDGTPCAQQGTLAMDGSDGGAIWLICPTIVDPRNGAIAPDAFLDQVVFPNGQPVDPNFALNFNCLQQKGQFPGQAAPNSTTPGSPDTLQPFTTILGQSQNTGTTAAGTGGATAGGPIGDGSEPTGACVQGSGSL